MPRKSDSYSYRAQLERAKAQRRIKSLEKIAGNEKLSASSRESASESIKELRAAIEATKQRVKTDSGYVRRTTEELDAGLKQLRSENAAGELYLGRNAQTNAVTQSEINRASVGLPSQYTKADTQVFYHATEEAWMQSGDGQKPISLHERNAAIVKYYGFKDLSEAFATIVQKNYEAKSVSNINPENDMTPEQAEIYDKEPTEAEEVSYEVENEVFAMLREMRDRIVKARRKS